jgi:2-polyprenyl-3-methyl-5-hydroxy-6-metoxy-1,4-benzoquinol methylase
VILKLCGPATLLGEECRVIEPDGYAGWRASPVGRVTERLEQDVIFGLSGDLRGRTVLDVACGDGTYSISSCKRGARVTGVDLSEVMLEAARRRAVDCQPGIAWCVASAEELPFDSEGFDVVIVVTALCFVKNPQRTIQEAARVLKPGGSMILGELGRYSLWAISRKIRGWLWLSTWSGAHFWTFQNLRRLIEQAGLRFHSRRTAVYFPPIGRIAQLLGGYDNALSPLGQFGAAFLALRADKV